MDDFAIAMLSGVLGAIAGWLFIAVFRLGKRGFERLFAPIYLRTTLAGLALGILAALFPLTRYYGHHELNSIIGAGFSPLALLGLALANMLAISITLTGGWRGGIIIPLFFTGACIGKAVALTIPGLNPVLAMICTMAALNAAVTRSPVSTTLLIAELTGFSTFKPVLFASLVCFFLAPKVPFIASQLPLKQGYSAE